MLGQLDKKHLLTEPTYKVEGRQIPLHHLRLDPMLGAK